MGEAAPPTWLVFGGRTGWIGQSIVRMLREQQQHVVIAATRLENKQDVERELDEVKPEYVMNCAGLTGRPNVDWCETNREQTILVNVVGTIALVDSCFRRGIHVTNFATGCIYHYDEDHTIGGTPFTEEDEPNFQGSFYSYTKIMAEKCKCPPSVMPLRKQLTANAQLQKEYKNVLILRLRMPVSDDLCQRNFVTKITKYAKVINIPNSMTVLHDLLPVAVEMARRGLVGVYNFTNPGAISHNEVLELFKKHVCPEFEWQNFDLEEHNKVVKALRSNNELDVSKLRKEFPDIPEIHVAMEQVMIRMRANVGQIDPPEKLK